MGRRVASVSSGCSIWANHQIRFAQREEGRLPGVRAWHERIGAGVFAPLTAVASQISLSANQACNLQNATLSDSDQPFRSSFRDLRTSKRELLAC